MCFKLKLYFRLPVQLYFTPIEEKEVNFNVVCQVKRKTLPLTLNVKAEGYAMNCLVTCEDSHGQKVKLSPEGLNEIGFGEVRILHSS
jgi:hydrocephalus-inducing protein